MSLVLGKKHLFKAPAICKAPPPDFPPGTILWPPPMIACAARWVDLDPLAPTDMAAYIDLAVLPGGGVWFGQTPDDGHRLAVTLTQKTPPHFFDVLFQIWDQWRNPENAFYGMVEADPDQPFQLRNVGDVHIPGSDYRFIKMIS